MGNEVVLIIIRCIAAANWYARFPSPMGNEVVLMEAKVLLCTNIILGEFPSPMGNEVVLIILLCNGYDWNQYWFPSPMGNEVVLIFHFEFLNTYYGGSFRPLWGMK